MGRRSYPIVNVMDEDKARFQLEIVGARLLGPPPIKDVWLSFEPGVHAFYGKNGAGKSRLLYALADLYAGKPSDGYLIARASSWHGSGSGRFKTVEVDVPIKTSQSPGEPPSRPWAAPDRTPWARKLGDVLWPTCARISGSTYTVESNEIDPHLYEQLDNLEELGDEERAELFQEIEESESTEYTPMSGSAIVAVIADIVATGLVALTPSKEGWRLAPAVIRDPALPWLRDEIDRIIRVADVVLKGRALEAALESYRLDHLNTLTVTLSPLFDAVEDGDVEVFQKEADLLRRADIVPYRLGDSTVFDGLRFVDAVGSVPQVIRDDDLSIGMVTAKTKDRLYRQAEAAGRPLMDGPDSLNSDLLGDARRISEATRLVYERFLVDAPFLVLVFMPPQDWFIRDDTVLWCTKLLSKVLPLEALSQAQRRWALAAIAIAEAGLPHATQELAYRDSFDALNDLVLPLVDSPFVVALDEPDGALHATAQRHAVDGLARFAKHRPATVWVSTHSREFLNHPDVTPHHVSRDAEGALITNKLGPPQRARVDELGLAPADLLLLHRAVLVVEGTHDQAVLDALIGDELAELRVLVLPMRGGRLLATVVDSYLLAHFSDTPVIAALDNLSAKKISAYWQDLLANRAGGQSSFDRVTSQHFTSRERDEETFLINYCRAAAELGQVQRFGVFGFSKEDIPEYLPVAAIVPQAGSWEVLRQEFAEQTKSRSFKPWLKHRYGVEITEELLRYAAEKLDAVPAEFADLLVACSRAQQSRT